MRTALKLLLALSGVLAFIELHAQRTHSSQPHAQDSIAYSKAFQVDSAAVGGAVRAIGTSSMICLGYAQTTDSAAHMDHIRIMGSLTTGSTSPVIILDEAPYTRVDGRIVSSTPWYDDPQPWDRTWYIDSLEKIALRTNGRIVPIGIGSFSFYSDRIEELIDTSFTGDCGIQVRSRIGKWLSQPRSLKSVLRQKHISNELDKTLKGCAPQIVEDSIVEHLTNLVQNLLTRRFVDFHGSNVVPARRSLNQLSRQKYNNLLYDRCLESGRERLFVITTNYELLTTSPYRKRSFLGLPYRPLMDLIEGHETVEDERIFKLASICFFDPEYSYSMFYAPLFFTNPRAFDSIEHWGYFQTEEGCFIDLNGWDRPFRATVVLGERDLRNKWGKSFDGMLFHRYPRGSKPEWISPYQIHYKHFIINKRYRPTLDVR